MSRLVAAPRKPCCVCVTVCSPPGAGCAGTRQQRGMPPQHSAWSPGSLAAQPQVGTAAGRSEGRTARAVSMCTRSHDLTLRSRQQPAPPTKQGPTQTPAASFRGLYSPPTQSQHHSRPPLPHSSSCQLRAQLKPPSTPSQMHPVAHLHGANGVSNDWPLACCDVKGDVHAGQGCEDVAEQDHTIWLERMPRLKGDLDLRRREGTRNAQHTAQHSKACQQASAPVAGVRAVDLAPSSGSSATHIRSCLCAAGALRC